MLFHFPSPFIPLNKGLCSARATSAEQGCLAEPKVKEFLCPLSYC